MSMGFDSLHAVGAAGGYPDCPNIYTSSDALVIR